MLMNETIGRKELSNLRMNQLGKLRIQKFNVQLQYVL